jgi:hypothetical protein
VKLLAAKTEFKTITSKITQHPAVTIMRIKLRRRVIELSIQTTIERAAAPSQSGDPDRTARMAWQGDVNVGQSVCDWE